MSKRNNNSHKYIRIYEKHHGPRPKDEYGNSFHIHHKDGNWANNDIDNLEALSHFDHYQRHKQQGDFFAAVMLKTSLIDENLSYLLKDRDYRGKNNPNYGHHWTSEMKRVASERRKGIKTGPRNLTEEQRTWYRDRVLGEKNPMYGKPGSFTGKHHTEENKKKFSKLMMGNVPWNKGKTGVYSQETLNKISNSHADVSGEKNPMYGQKHSPETKEKIRQKALERHKKKRECSI